MDSLIKQFKNKADEEGVQKGFEQVDLKIIGLGETLSLLKREIDTIARGSHTMSRTSDNAFISIKSALPKSCLSCGGTPSNPPTNNSFSVKRNEKVQLKEKDTSGDRPSTAANFKMKMFPGPTINAANVTTSQGFGFRVSGTSTGSRLENIK